MDPIYKFKIAEKMFALDVEGCFVFEVDHITWEILDYFGKTDARDITDRLGKRFDPREVENVILELEILRDQDYILAQDGGKEEESGKVPLESISLLLTGDSRDDFQITKAMAEKAVNFLIMKSEGGRKLKVEFIASPSLLNQDIIEHICNYAAIQGEIFKKDFQFCLTIIGSTFGEDKGSGEINISFDFSGWKDLRRLLRYLSAKKKEGEDQLLKIAKYAAGFEKKNLPVQVNYIPNSPEFSQSINSLFDRGFSSISMGCRHSIATAHHFLKNGKNFLKDRYEIVAREYSRRLEGNGDLVLYPFKPVIAQVYQGKRCPRRCWAGQKHLAISPGGDVYPCPQFLKMDEWRMGNINNLDYDLTREAIFCNLSVNEKEDCLNCWARYFCGGGCPLSAFLFNGRITGPYREECNLIKDIIKLGVMAYDNLEEKTNLLHQVGSEKKTAPFGFSLKDGQINLRMIEKSDFEIISRWKDDFLHSYFLLEEMAMGLSPGEAGGEAKGTGRLEVIMEGKDKALLGLFCGWISPPFKRGEISFFIPDGEKLKQPEFYQLGLSLLNNIFRRWKLPRLFTTLLERETDYIEYLKQFGFKPEGVLKEQIFHQGRYHNLITLGMQKGGLKKKWW